jgi:hypothetical protein
MQEKQNFLPCADSREPDRIAFVQPFGIGSPGGGPRILRALLKDAPVEWKSFVTGNIVPPPPFGTEMHLPSRPFFGRIERSRMRPLLEKIAPFFEKRFQRRLEKELNAFRATGVHFIPHGADFISAWRAAQSLGLRFFVSIHDDLFASLTMDSIGRHALNFFPEIWREATARLVISKQLGDEFCSRYGERHYEVITDGAEVFNHPRARVAGRLNIYFMGLFHLRYEPNLSCLTRAVEILQRQNPSLVVSITLRCGGLRRGFHPGGAPVQILPLGSESDVENDLAKMDLLYMPLPFQSEDEAFVRFSLSTKLVTYLVSGIPILFHGPKNSAACALLSEAYAALVFDSLEIKAMAEALANVVLNPEDCLYCVERSLLLARRQFQLSDQRNRFWTTLTMNEAQTSFPALEMINP